MISSVNVPSKDNKVISFLLPDNSVQCMYYGALSWFMTLIAFV